MSQVGLSRPGTQQSLVGRLPQIQHPLARITSPGGMDVRGVSRSGDRPASQGSEGRPLATEYRYTSRRSAMGSSRGRQSALSKSMPDPPLNKYESIPEGVAVAHGDPSKPRMPVFGNRADVMTRPETANSRADIQSRVSSRLSRAPSQMRLEIDELEAILREKAKTGYTEMKKRFKDNDPEQKGNVSRDAFFRIVITVTNKPVSQSQFARLMERLGFKDRAVIPFMDFFAHFREVQSAEQRWMDPVHRSDRGNMSASQVHTLLKERAKQRIGDLSEMIPQLNPDGSGRVLRPELKNVLNKLGYQMDDSEFDKLWNRYDTDGIGVIDGVKMMSKLGVSKDDRPTGDDNRPGSTADEDTTGSRKPSKREMERQRSLNIERWLKDKFREGFFQMKRAFENCDNAKSGLVSHVQFLSILSDFGLTIEKPHLAEFLARCSVSPTQTSVPYREFLHRFQDRSEGGMTHTVLNNNKHRFNRADSPDNMSTFSALETQLLNMFQRDFLALLGTFHKIDKLGLDMISPEEFRAAIESRFELEMTEDQFQILLDRVPLDHDGNVKYAEFMAQFDTRGKTKSLYTELNRPQYKNVGALPEDPSPPPPQVSPRNGEDSHKPIDRLVVDRNDEAYLIEVTPKRSPQQLFKIIKNLLKKDYQALEEAFIEIDEQNSRRLSQDMMFQLLKKFKVEPEVTRGEIRDLWKTFITNQDKTLNFIQFTRHFGYSMKSASFPNAKVVPPRRGDSDFMMRSRKLNCAADMLQDSLRSKIDYMWEDLRREFVAMDPYSTGYVSSEEFRDVLSELCVHLSNYELDMLQNKFNNTGDGRVSYIEFLKPFAMRKSTWRHGNNMLALLQHPVSELPMGDITEPPQNGLTGVTLKLRQKLKSDWKTLRRAFKKIDSQNAGAVSIPEFRSVLKLVNVVLSEEEVYQILSQFDGDMSGKIPYNAFLSETFRETSSRDDQKLLRGSALF